MAKKDSLEVLGPNAKYTGMTDHGDGGPGRGGNAQNISVNHPGQVKGAETSSEKSNASRQPKSDKDVSRTYAGYETKQAGPSETGTQKKTMGNQGMKRSFEEKI